MAILRYGGKPKEQVMFVKMNNNYVDITDAKQFYVLKNRTADFAPEYGGSDMILYTKKNGGWVELPYHFGVKTFGTASHTGSGFLPSEFVVGKGIVGSDITRVSITDLRVIMQERTTVLFYYGTTENPLLRFADTSVGGNLYLCGSTTKTPLRKINGNPDYENSTIDLDMVFSPDTELCTITIGRSSPEYTYQEYVTTRTYNPDQFLLPLRFKYTSAEYPNGVEFRYRVDVH